MEFRLRHQALAWYGAASLLLIHQGVTTTIEQSIALLTPIGLILGYGELKKKLKK